MDFFGRRRISGLFQAAAKKFRPAWYCRALHGTIKYHWESMSTSYHRYAYVGIILMLASPIGPQISFFHRLSNLLSRCVVVGSIESHGPCPMLFWENDHFEMYQTHPWEMIIFENTNLWNKYHIKFIHLQLKGFHHCYIML